MQQHCTKGFLRCWINTYKKTQFGFRKDQSTADALYLVRRIAELGEKTTDKLLLVLLDWEKAFDKVNREGLMIALERMGVDSELIKKVRAIYKNTEFMVEIEGKQSN